MKHFITISLFLLIGLASASCNKEADWQCECDIAGDRTVVAVYSEKKNDAKEKCAQIDKSNSIYTNCKIK